MQNKLPMLLLVFLFLSCFIVILLIVKLSITSSNTISWKNSIQNYNNEYFIEGNDKIINGVNNLDQTGSTLFLFTTIDKIIKDKDTVKAQTSTIVNNKLVTYDITIFDSKIFKSLFIVSSNDQHYPTAAQTKVKQLNDSNSAYIEAKKTEGRLVELLVRLQAPPNNENSLICNKSLLNLIQGKTKSFNCLPFTYQIYYYEK